MSDHWGTPPQPEQPAQPEVLSSQPGASYPAAPYAAAPLTYFGSGDILGAAEPSRRGGGKGKLAAVGVAVVAVAAIGVGGAYAAGAFGHDSTQPAAFVPATAVGYVSIDLDPSLGQKVDALRFLRKFPAAKASLGSTDDLRQWIFEQAVKDDPTLSKLSYAADVKPWIGDRFGAALLPGAKAGAAPTAVVVLQVTDEGKAKVGLKQLMAGPGGGTCAVAKGYAVCGETAAIVGSAQSAAAEHPLAKDARFTADVAAAGSPGIALAWGDLGKLAALIPSATQSLGGAMAGSTTGGLGGLGGLSAIGGAGALGAAGPATSGRFVAAVRFDGGNLEVTGKTVGTTTSVPVASGGTGVEQLPDRTLVALGARLDPRAVDTAYRSMQTQLKASGGGDLLGGLQQELARMGFHLPHDLDVLIGTKLDIAFGGIGADGMPLIGVRSNSPEAQAKPVLDRISTQLAHTGTPFALHPKGVPGGGYAVALNEAYAAQLAAGGHLGTQAGFQVAVPDAAGATSVLYVNIAGLLGQPSLRSLTSGSAGANLRALSAIGASATSSPNGSSSFRVEVITR